jgi:hypothetical protein
MNLKVKNNLSVISLINNKLSTLAAENAKKVLSDLLMIYSKETTGTDIVATLKTIAYCCSKLEGMGAREGNLVVRFLFEQYADLVGMTEEKLAANPYLDDEDPNSAFTELEGLYGK